LTTSDTLADLIPFIHQVGTPRQFQVGDTLIVQGRHDQQVYYIESGEVEVIRDGVPIKRIGGGDIVGEYAFIDNRPRSASVVAVAPLEVMELDRETVLQGAGDHLLFLSRFLTVITSRMKRRMRLDRERSVQPFLLELTAEAASHRAVNHPYLQALCTGDLPDVRWALADFGRQYYAYSAHFPRYLTKTISQLCDPSHRAALMENLTEEAGNYSDEDLTRLQAAGIQTEWIDGVPHPELFQRFRSAMGVSLSDVEEDSLEVVCWREMFLDVLGEGTPAQTIGALGPGTEGIVSTMYKNFLPALDQVNLDPRDTVFFPLHAEVDDHHQETLMDIAADFAETEEGRQDLVKGMRKALFLRAGFWDWMLDRARHPERYQPRS